MNGGTCESLRDYDAKGFKCTCQEGYTGTYCDVPETCKLHFQACLKLHAMSVETGISNLCVCAHQMIEIELKILITYKNRTSDDFLKNIILGDCKIGEGRILVIL